MANPAPLGLCAFALTTFVLSAVNLDTHGVSVPNIAVPPALCYGGLVQLLAGMWEMSAGNTFGAVALSSYGAFWLAYAVLHTPSFAVLAAYHDVPAMASSAVGLFLVAWLVFSIMMTLLTLRSTAAFAALFLALDVTFLLLAAAEFADSEERVGLTRAGGVTGMMTAFLAGYNAFAGMANTSNFFCDIPVLPFPWSEKGLEARMQKREREQV